MIHTCPLLQVLQDASVAEVVDMPAEVHQLGVNVCGHTSVGGGGEVGAAGHHAGAASWGSFSTPLHQGTKSVIRKHLLSNQTTELNSYLQSERWRPRVPWS